MREDNKRLGKTETHEYDGNGNILAKRVYAFTLLSELEEITHETVTYAYDGDKLVSYGGEECVYDGIGNPTIYRGKTAIWNKGREMTSYNGVTFSYDGRGRRVGKGNISFTYTSDGKLLGQSDGIEFIYDASGIAGIEYNGSTYLFRRDAQGNVIALIDSAGNVVVQYAYDAWGNHAVLGVGGEDITDPAHIGNINPIRYRGYYYDSEVDLYFLQTRYYDPTTGRFVTIDGIEYADPETLNGLNLYAYCGNNPVMNVDPDGTVFWFIIAAVVISTIIGGLNGGITAAMNEQSFWKGFAAGAIGGFVGGMISMIPFLGLFAAPIGNFVGSLTSSVLNELFQNGSFDGLQNFDFWKNAFKDATFSALTANVKLIASDNLLNYLVTEIAGIFVTGIRTFLSIFGDDILGLIFGKKKMLQRG